MQVACADAGRSVLQKHSTLGLCFADERRPPSVAVALCCSVGTEELPSLRHRLLLFGFVTISTLVLAAAVLLGLKSRVAAYGAACCILFPLSLLMRSFLANVSVWLAQACGDPVIRAEEWALLALGLGTFYWLSIQSSTQSAAVTLVVAGHAWLTLQVGEAAFLFLVHWACSCCGCCYILGLRRRALRPMRDRAVEADGGSDVPACKPSPIKDGQRSLHVTAGDDHPLSIDSLEAGASKAELERRPMALEMR